MKNTQTVPEQLKSIDSYIREKHGNKPTYKQFFDSYLEKFREQHPNSGTPSRKLLDMFYDDFINEKQIIGY